MEYLCALELKNGRIPEGINRRMVYWKAEEFQKFAFPASEYILCGILPDHEYHIWLLAVRITEMVFGCGRNGLTTSKNVASWVDRIIAM